MRAVIQRVSRASVSVENRIAGRIDKGLLVLLGVKKGDTEADADYLADKVVGLRVFADSEGKMNLAVKDAGGAVLVVSQFTLLGSCRKGRRPSFDDAAAPELARTLYDYFLARVRRQGVIAEAGVFQAHMEVELVNSGPVTLIIDSQV